MQICNSRPVMEHRGNLGIGRMTDAGTGARTQGRRKGSIKGWEGTGSFSLSDEGLMVPVQFSE